MATQYPAWAQPAPKKPTRAASQPLKTVDQLATLAPAQAAATVSRGPAIMGAAGQPPARNDMLMGAAKNPAWAQGAAAPAAPAKPNLTNLYQTSMTVANPSLARVAPGAPTIPGRERMNEQVAGYTDMVNPAASGINPVAPRAAWQPNMDAWKPGAGPLALQASQFADQAAQRQATEAANQATMNRMQAQRRPEFGTHGGRLANPAPGYQEYLAAARAFRDGTGPDPGAWRGSPGDMPAPAPPTEAQMARRAAWNDTKAARRRMVTARAQGQRMTPEQALGSVMAMRGDNLTDEQLLAGWGGAPMWMRTQQRIAEVPFGANAQAMAQAQQASSERIAALPWGEAARQMKADELSSNERIAAWNADAQREQATAYRDVGMAQYSPEQREAAAQNAQYGMIANYLSSLNGQPIDPEMLEYIGGILQRRSATQPQLADIVQSQPRDPNRDIDQDLGAEVTREEASSITSPQAPTFEQLRKNLDPTLRREFTQAFLSGDRDAAETYLRAGGVPEAVRTAFWRSVNGTPYASAANPTGSTMRAVIQQPRPSLGPAYVPIGF